jgi:CHAT domain-containing protein
MLDLYIRNGLVMAMLIRPDTIVWVTTPYDEAAHEALGKLKAESLLFQEYQQLPEQEYLSRMQMFADLSHKVYQFLIAPVRKMMLEEVILIPRNELATFPFGALLTQAETNLGKPFQWHFLDNELVTSQIYSASLFQFVQERKPRHPSTQSVLALAPFFESDLDAEVKLPAGNLEDLMRRDAFRALPNSGVEAQSIASLTKGKALLGIEANKESLFQLVDDYNILHFATHSAANDVLGEYSYIALQSAGGSKKIDMLYARDIYGLSLAADLVVLSACETALGQFRYGDGVIGLNRAFTCAGVNNIVSSLWSVNDASTKSLMILFYTEINKGLPYNRALANAKRRFIQENKWHAHPYFWAGFVLSGR